jgi:ADP-ribosylglycohydrolase
MSLLNGALGDAIGGPLEFLDRSTIDTQFPHQLSSLLEHAPSLQITDDTQMTLYTLAGLLDDSNENPEDFIRHAYLAWYAGQTSDGDSKLNDENWIGRLSTNSTVNAVRAPGQTCLSALALGGHGTVASPINHSKGCGGVMRVAPIAWRISDLGDAVELAVKTTAMTHGHPLGYQSAGLLVWILWSRLQEGQSLSEVTKHLLSNWFGYEEPLQDLIQWAFEFGNRPDAPRMHPQLLGEGWVGEEALAIALCHALRAEATQKPLSEILWDAAAHDGDSDSTAAIAGNLIISPRYDTLALKALERIDALRVLLDMSEALIEMANKKTNINYA